jgi:hypothetical protein
MAKPTHVPREGIAQLAGRILTAWRNGEPSGLRQELEQVRCLADRTDHSSTIESEKLEVLCGVVETLGYARGQHAGAVRLLEHLANTDAPSKTRLSPPPVNTLSCGA